MPQVTSVLIVHNMLLEESHSLSEVPIFGAQSILLSAMNQNRQGYGKLIDSFQGRKENCAKEEDNGTN